MQTNPVLQSVSFERKYGGRWPQTTIQPPESQQAGQSAQRRIETNHQQTIRQLGVLIGIKSKQLKNQVDLEDFYKDGPDETENQNPRMFFDEISALESQVILVLPPRKTFSLTLLGNIKTDKVSSWGINNLYWIWCLSLQIAQPPDSNYIATHQSTDIGKLLLQETENLYSCTSGDFEKLKEPEDQVAMESVRSDLILWDLLDIFAAGLQPAGDGVCEETLKDNQPPPSQARPGRGERSPSANNLGAADTQE